MSRLPLTILTLLLLAVSTLGQTTSADCPKLTVVGPARVTTPGEAMIFRAELYENFQTLSIGGRFPLQRRQATEIEY